MVKVKTVLPVRDILIKYMKRVNVERNENSGRWLKERGSRKTDDKPEKRNEKVFHRKEKTKINKKKNKETEPSVRTD